MSLWVTPFTPFFATADGTRLGEEKHPATRFSANRKGQGQEIHATKWELGFVSKPSLNLYPN
jgi:hypothetical protein